MTPVINTPFSLDLYSWNVNGTQDAIKSRNIRQQMFDKGIYFLQETHKLSARDAQRFNAAAPHCYYKNGTSNRNGVLLSIPLHNTHITQFPSTTNLYDGNDRLIITKIKWFDLHILLVNIYAPPSNPSDRALFFDQLHARLSNESLPIIMAGDFNCWTHPLDHHSESHPGNNTDLISLTTMLTSLQLKDIWRDHNQNSTRKTYGPHHS